MKPKNSAVCPFYLMDDNTHTIVCEGIIDKSRVMHDMHSLTRFNEHYNKYCCDNCEACEYHYVMMRYKYRE